MTGAAHLATDQATAGVPSRRRITLATSGRHEEPALDLDDVFDVGDVFGQASLASLAFLGVGAAGGGASPWKRSE